MTIPNRKKLEIKNPLFLIIISIITSLGSFLTGYSIACISELQKLIKNKNNLDDYSINIQLSIITSIFSIGAIIGSLFYKKIVNMVGQCLLFKIIDIFSIFLISIQLIQLQYKYLVFSRFFLGFFIGISTALLPVYLNSLAPLQMTGRIGAMNQILITLGILCAYLSGYLIDENDVLDQKYWRIMLMIPIIACSVRLIFFTFFLNFDSLQRHIINNQTKKLEDYCQLFYKNATLEDLKQIKTIPFSKSTSSQQNYDSPKRLVIAIIIIVSNQLSGINGIFNYAEQLFNKIDNGNIQQSKKLIIFLGFNQVIAAFLSRYIIDKVSRRSIMLIGQAFIICILNLIYLTATTNEIGQLQHQNLIIALIFLHVIIFNFTMGPICIIYAAQIVYDITYVIFALKLIVTIVALCSQFMIKYFGIGEMFFIYGICSLMAFLFLNKVLIDTRKKSRKQICELYDVEFLKEKVNNRINPPVQQEINLKNQQA